MDSLETIRVAITAIRRNKIRSFLTVLGIVIGVSSVILLIAIGGGIKNYVTGQLESLGSNLIIVMPGKISFKLGGTEPTGSMLSSKLRMRHVKRLERRGGGAISAVSPAIEASAKVRQRGKTKFTQVNGVNENFAYIFNLNVDQGRFFTKSDVTGSKRVAVLGPTVAAKLFASLNPVGKKVTVDDTVYKVVGVLQPKGAIGGVNVDDNIYIPAPTVMRQFDLVRLHGIYIKARDEETLEEAIQRVKSLLGEDLEQEEFTVLNQKDLLSSLSQIFSFLTLALGGIAAISLIVGGIGIMNIMFVSVTERTQEIGLRKAVGATGRNILVQFLFEAIVLSLLGGSIGFSLGAGVSLLLSKWLQTQISFWSVILAIGFSSLVGIVFGVAPAIKAARFDPIQALRYE
jgi:putative ABC transport system permease protein